MRRGWVGRLGESGLGAGLGLPLFDRSKRGKKIDALDQSISQSKCVAFGFDLDRSIGRSRGSVSAWRFGLGRRRVSPMSTPEERSRERTDGCHGGPLEGGSRNETSDVAESQGVSRRPTEGLAFGVVFPYPPFAFPLLGSLRPIPNGSNSLIGSICCAQPCGGGARHRLHAGERAARTRLFQTRPSIQLSTNEELAHDGATDSPPPLDTSFRDRPRVVWARGGPSAAPTALSTPPVALSATGGASILAHASSLASARSTPAA